MAKPGPDKALCGARLPNRDDGKTCEHPAGYRTSHLGVGNCYRHGGATPTHEIAAQRELLRRDCERLGIPIEVDPAEALLQCVYEAAGNVAFYRALVDQLPGDEGGVYGKTYHVSGKPTGEAKPHVLVQLYNEERTRLVAFAKVCLDHKIDERRVQLAERDATAVAQAQIAALIAMGLQDRLEQFRAEFHRSYGQPLALDA